VHQPSVDRIGGECVRIKVAAQPLTSLFVIRMFRVADPVDDVVPVAIMKARFWYIWFLDSPSGNAVPNCYLLSSNLLPSHLCHNSLWPGEHILFSQSREQV
jgi:hypothetical protein